MSQVFGREAAQCRVVASELVIQVDMNMKSGTEAKRSTLFDYGLQNAPAPAPLLRRKEERRNEGMDFGQSVIESESERE